MLCLIAAFILLVCLWAESKAGRSLGGNYDLMNSVLGNMELEVDTSTMDPIVTGVGLGITATVTLADAAKCVGMGIGDISIAHAFDSQKYLYNGTLYEKYDLDIILSNVEVTCTIGLCMKTDFFLDFEEECTGTVTITSLPSSNSRVHMTQMVLSENFLLNPPTYAMDVPKTCAETVDLLGVTFSGVDIGTVAGIDVTSFVVNVLNGDKKAEAVEPLQEAVCDMMTNVTALLNNLLVINPFTNQTNFGIDPTETIGIEALEIEEQVHASLPKSVDLMDLGNNFIMDIFFPNQNGTIVISPDLFQLGCNETEADNTTTPVWDFIDTFLGTNMSANGGIIEQLDVIEVITPIVEPMLSGENLSDFLSINMTLDGIGTIGGSLHSLKFSSTPVDDPLTGGFEIMFLGKQTFVLPPLEFGDMVIEAELGLSMDIETNMLLNQTIAFSLSEDFNLELRWDGFVAYIAAMLAVDMAKVSDLQLGPLFKHVMDCALAIFYRTPVITGAVIGAEQIHLLLSGFVDGIFHLIADLFNALIPIYQGLVPGMVELLLKSSIINQEVISPTTCPEAEVNDLPYDFSEGPFSLISSLVKAETLECLLKRVIPGDVGGFQLIEEPISEKLDLPPVSDQRTDVAEIKLMSLGLNGLSPPSIDKLMLLGTPLTNQYYPQGLWNQLGIGEESNPLVLNVALELNVFGETSNAGRRQLSQDQSNKLNITLSLDSLELLMEIFAAFSTNFVERTKLRDMLNLDCWVSGLQPYGGLKQLVLELNNVVLQMDCVSCENKLLEELSERLSDPVAFQDLMNVVNDLKVSLLQSGTDLFSRENFEATIAAATERCTNAGSTTTSDEDDEPLKVSQDLTRSYTFAAIFFGSLGLIGACTFGCSFAGKPRKNDAVHKENKLTSEEEEVRQLENIPLWNHPSVPEGFQILVPVTILLNLVLFLLGHIDVAMYTDVVGHVLGIEFKMDNVSKLSVLNTITKLWEGEAYVLALMLLVFSVIWPYVKLVGLIITWFLPTKILSFRRRGTIITVLDQLGKWSLVELFFLLFFFVVMQISIRSPSHLSFLPAELYHLGLVLEPQFNLYTFCTALLLSLLLSNIVVIFHERIENQVLQIERQKRGLDGADHTKLGLHEYLFEKEDENGNKFRIGLNTRGVSVLCFVTGLSVAAIIYAGLLPVISLDIIGLAKVAMEVSNQDTVIEIGLYSFIKDAFSDATVGEIYFGVVFVMSVVVIPILQLSMLVVMPFKKFTLPQAIRYLEINQVLSAWSCLLPFVLAMSVTTLEITSATSFLVKDLCDGIGPIMEQVNGLGLFTENDVAASCLGITARIENGSFVFFAALLLADLSHLFMIKLFEFYIHSRKDSSIHFDVDMEVPASEEDDTAANVGCTIALLNMMHLLEVENQRSASKPDNAMITPVV